MDERKLSYELARVIEPSWWILAAMLMVLVRLLAKSSRKKCLGNEAEGEPTAHLLEISTHHRLPQLDFILYSFILLAETAASIDFFFK